MRRTGRNHFNSVSEVFGRISGSLAVHTVQQKVLLLRRASALWKISAKQRDGILGRRDTHYPHQIEYVEPLCFTPERVHDPECFQLEREQILRRGHQNRKSCRRRVPREGTKLKMIGGIIGKCTEMNPVVEPVFCPL